MSEEATLNGTSYNPDGEVIPVTPEPRMKGRFNLFDTPDGGLHISYLIDGTEEIQHINIPGQVLSMAKMLESGKMSPKHLMGFFKNMGGK